MGTRASLRRGMLVLGLALPWWVACGGSREPAPKPTPAPEANAGLGTQTANAASDTHVLSDAQDAANRVIRAAGDCDAVRAGLPDAREALDTASKRVRTPTGRTVLETLTRQLDRIESACP